MSSTITDGICVATEPQYVPDHSEPGQGRYFFSYSISISNQGDRPARLVSRRWLITDGEGKQETVEGPGVVGEQPRLEPGETFRYISFCPLGTEVGTMEGSFQMVRDDGSQFDAKIAPFTLAAPHALN